MIDTIATPPTTEAKLREAIRDAGFAVMQTSGKWSIHCVTDAAKQAEEVEYRLVNENIDLAEQVRLLREACIRASLTGSIGASAAKILTEALAATAPTPTEDRK